MQMAVINGSYNIVLKIPNILLDILPFTNRPKKKNRNKRNKTKPTTQYAKFRRDVLTIWDYKCAKCGKKYGTVRLGVHHFFPYHKYQDYSLDPDYAAPLCVDECHKDFHLEYSFDEFGPEDFYEFIGMQNSK